MGEQHKIVFMVLQLSFVFLVNAALDKIGTWDLKSFLLYNMLE